MQCVICSGEIEKQRNPETGEVFWEGGHNAQPVAEGQCCGECNTNVVLPKRFAQVYQQQS